MKEKTKYAVEMYQDEEGGIILVSYMHGVTSPDFAAHVELYPGPVQLACDIIANPGNEKLWSNHKEGVCLEKQVEDIQTRYRCGELALIYTRHDGDKYNPPSEHFWRDEADTNALAVLIELGLVEVN